MRKIISIISLMLCMLVCLTACGEKNSNVDATKDSQPQGYVAMAEDEGGSTLVGVGFMLYDSKGTELTWLPMATNARGKVEFKDCKEPGCYVQVKTVPVGYELDSETKHYFDEKGSVKVTIKKDANADLLEVYEASIGTKRYAQFTEALLEANNSKEDVTITLASDVTVQAVVIENYSSKKVTIDGAGHTLTTEGGNNAIALSQAESVVEFTNLTINHKNAGSILQITAGLTVNLTNVVINATEGPQYNYGLIHTMAAETTTNLNLTGVKVNWKVASKAANDPAVIRTGNNGVDQTKVVNTTLIDCDFDVAGAPERAGIRYMDSTSGDIVIKNSKITTGDAYCVKANYQHVTLENVTFNSTNSKYKNEPIGDRGIVVSDNAKQAYDPGVIAKIGDKEYHVFPVAFRDAYSMRGDVVIELTADVTMTEINVNSMPNKKITLEGNGHTVITEGGNNAFKINTAGTFEFRNLTIDHRNTGSVIQNYALNTIELTDVNINATRGEAYNYCLINFMSAGDTCYLNMTRVNVKMAVGTAGKDSNSAVIRTGHGTVDDTKTVVFNLTDCTIDTTGATERVGILIMATTTAYVKLTNTTIKTMDEYAIRANHQTFILNNTKLGSNLPLFNQKPIENDSNVVKQ